MTTSWYWVLFVFIKGHISIQSCSPRASLPTSRDGAGDVRIFRGLRRVRLGQESEFDHPPSLFNDWHGDNAAGFFRAAEMTDYSTSPLILGLDGITVSTVTTVGKVIDREMCG